MMTKHDVSLQLTMLVLLVTLSACWGWSWTIDSTTPITASKAWRRRRCTMISHHQTASSSSSRLLLHASKNPTSSSSISNKEQPTKNTASMKKNRSSSERVGFGQWLLDRALASPLWEHVLVPLARRKIVETARANGIDWDECKSWLKSQEGPWNSNADSSNSTTASMMITNDEMMMNTNMIPDYYRNAPYHAYYPHGNLCWEAALEVEIASKAVGARNFPAFGKNGEDAFRDSFGVALDEITGGIIRMPSSSSSTRGRASMDDNDNKKNDEFIMVDLGCGTGMSTRWLARRYPQATKILGMDLSPYFIEVGKRLLELAPRQRQDDDHDIHQPEDQGTWVSTIQRDDRIEYVWGNAAHTGLPDNYCNVVNLQFVAHELPVSVTCDIIREAYRILKAPSHSDDGSASNGGAGGQLWFCEMDFESPGYAAQRANPLLFSLIRSTEPYLDEYANHAAEIRQCLQETFDDVVITAATGRHFAICATKKKQTRAQEQESRMVGTLRDLRFDQHGDYRVEDTHLKVWENKG